MFENQSGNYMEVIEDISIKVCKTTISNQQMSNFLTLYQLQLLTLYHKIGLCNLFPVLFKCVTFLSIK